MLVLIYTLVVGWFRSFRTPFIIMAAIPFSLVGILPAHWGFDAFFTATSMIGMIALAGIIVRNSILLVDFINLELAAGESLENAVVKAGVVRFRPIALTAAALVATALDTTGIVVWEDHFCASHSSRRGQPAAIQLHSSSYRQSVERPIRTGCGISPAASQVRHVRSDLLHIAAACLAGTS